MADAAAKPFRRPSRFWLYTPFVLLALVALAWSAAWFVVRDRVGDALDDALAAERQAGRQWTCQDRGIVGFPFRVEVSCASLTMRRADTTASLGRVRVFAQVYQPRHVIAQVAGPARLTDGTMVVDAAWRHLESSVRGVGRSLQRASLAVEEPRVTVTGAEPGPLAWSGESLEAHLRPSPTGREQGAYDVALTASKARIPALDALLGGPEPADIQLDVTATQADEVRGRPLPEELERWRQDDGRLKVLLLSIAKGPRRVEARGELRLDAMHRPEGELTVAAAGAEELVSALAGEGAGGFLGALVGQRPRAARPNPTDLKPLPPLRLADGRVAVGPLAVPNLRLPALY